MKLTKEFSLARLARVQTETKSGPVVNWLDAFTAISAAIANPLAAMLKTAPARPGYVKHKARRIAANATLLALLKKS